MLSKRDRVLNGGVKDAIGVAPLFEATIPGLGLQLAGLLPVYSKVEVFAVRVVCKVAHLLRQQGFDVQFAHLSILNLF